MPVPLLRPLVLAALLTAPVLAVPAVADVDPGAYLAARIAGNRGDFREGSEWYARALNADPSSRALMEGAVLAHVGANDFVAAIKVAQRLVLAGAEVQTAHIVMIADQTRRGDFDALLRDQAAGRKVGVLLDGLVTAWGQVGAGKMTDALASFDALIANKPLAAFGLYHKAMALASVGDYEGAEAILSAEGDMALALLRRGLMARAQILSQLERNPDAVALLERAFPNEQDPGIAGMIAALNAGATLPFDITRNATDGMAEVFFTLGVALNGEAGNDYTLVYARVATYLRPDLDDAALMSGALLEQMNQFTLAAETYAGIAPERPSFYAAEIGRARALAGADKPDEGIEVLRGLAAREPGALGVHLALGDALRREDRWAEATTAYDAAIGLIDGPNRNYWSVYFSRAVVLERQKLWDRAEADLRRALELSPDQPQVLNYLGYSYLERNERLEEALAMIQKAVAAQPDAGYIVDSLAWGLYLMGRYDEALAPMERASLLEPVDPVVTDHLGDVYWAVGRTLEARFQWRRALSFDPEEKTATRIRRKLEVGLDEVLKEEGAKPITSKDAPQTDL